MKNPIGPYPGRQLFLGLTPNGKPVLAYLVTGRSPASRERKALPKDNDIIIGPIGNQPYDPLRHYTGIKYDNTSGIIVVSNGIQTEAIYETYRLLHNTNSLATKTYMEAILDGAQAEPDSYHTPRIAGTITINNKNIAYIIGIKRNDKPAKALLVEPDKGTLQGISTYDGDMDNPKSFNPDPGLPKLKIKTNTAQELTEYIYNISAATYQEQDIRVCSIGAIYDGKSWTIAIKNNNP